MNDETKNAGPKEKVYSESEIVAKLKEELPHWRYENGWIRRKYKTHSWKSTLMVINTDGHLAEAAWHHPDITASYAWVEVLLQNHAAKGITDRQLRALERAQDKFERGATRGDNAAMTRSNSNFHYVILAIVVVSFLPIALEFVKSRRVVKSL